MTDAPTPSSLESGSHRIHVGGVGGLGGVAQNYHVFGSGPVCVVHPGGPGIAWQYLRMRSLESFMTVVYVEPIGTGGSGRLPSHPHGYTVERYAMHLEAILDHLACEGVLLLGHSHGGFVAQRYASHHPERVAGLVLYDTVAHAGPEMFIEADTQLRRFVEANSAHVECAFISQAWSTVSRIDSDCSFTAALRALLPAYFHDYWGRRAEFQSFESNLAGFHVSSGSAFDGRQSIQGIATPTLVLVGEHDFICGIRWAKALHGALPNSTLVTFHSSGHFAHLEETAAFTHAVRAFADATFPKP